jgi:hypothetical protein
MQERRPVNNAQTLLVMVNVLSAKPPPTNVKAAYPVTDFGKRLKREG